MLFTGGVTILSLTFDSLTAYVLARLDFPGKKVLFVLILVTLMLPFQVNLVPLFLLLNKLHWLNTYQGQHVVEYGLIMAGSVLAIVPMVIAFLLIQRRFTESIATSGLR